MADRILLCGLNGCGISTLGAVLARRMGYLHIDIEDYFFPAYHPVYKYASQRPLEEVRRLLLEDLRRYDRVIFSAVKGDYGQQVQSLFDRAVYLYAPKEVRMDRIAHRSREQFGERAEHGGDLYEKEQAFLTAVSGREEEQVLSWLKQLDIPVFPVDAAPPVMEVAQACMEKLGSWKENGV